MYCLPGLFFGKVPLMGRSPWVWGAPGCKFVVAHPGNPRLETLASLLKKIVRQACSVREAGEGGAGAAQTWLKSKIGAGSYWPGPANPLPSLELGMYS